MSEEENKDEKIELEGINTENVMEELNKIDDFNPMESKVEYREWNDEMLEWIKSYKESLIESYNKGNISEQKYNELLRQLRNLKDEFIDKEYIDELIDHVNQMDLSFLSSKQELEKGEQSFDKFVKSNSMRQGANPSVFDDVVNLTIKQFAETDEEIKAFKSILNKLVQQHNLINETNKRKFKFINLFLKSMSKYSIPLFNAIAKSYINYSKTDSEV